MSEKTNDLKRCCFCGLSENNELVFGKIYEHDGIITHYYCLLLSSKMEQKGNDDEGILGFLADDIKKELRRGRRLICTYCKKVGATLGCCNIKCKRVFHYPCGLRAGALNQFFGEFRSYCIYHRPKQKINGYIERSTKEHKDSFCCICYDKVNLLDQTDILQAPCCKKDVWFHRKCVQQLAINAGYFFKCPLCNNNKEFQNEMLQYGIFIPSQDASWELEPNAFQDLLYRHNRCDALTCLCPKGRHHTSMNAKWELALCRTCGSQGIHMACGQLKWAKPVWNCNDCTSILGKVEKSENSKPETINITHHDSDADSSDSEISVGGMEDKDDLLSSYTHIRPGPLSFKIQEAQENKSTSIMCSKDNLTNSSQDIFVTSTPKILTSSKLQRNESVEKGNKCSSSRNKILPETDRERNCTRTSISTTAIADTNVIQIDSDDDEVQILNSPTLKAKIDKETKINNLKQSVNISCKASSSLGVPKQTATIDNILGNASNSLSIEKEKRNSNNTAVIKKLEFEILDNNEVTILASKSHRGLDNSSSKNIKSNITALPLDNFKNKHNLKNTDNDEVFQKETSPLMNFDSSTDSKTRSTKLQCSEAQSNESELGSKRKYEPNICVIGTHTNGVKTIALNKNKKLKRDSSEENIKDPCSTVIFNKANFHTRDQISIQLLQKGIKNINTNMDEPVESSNSLENMKSKNNRNRYRLSSLLGASNHNLVKGKIDNTRSINLNQSTSEDAILSDFLCDDNTLEFTIGKEVTITRKNKKQSICDRDASTSSAEDSTKSYAAVEDGRIDSGVPATAKWTNLLQSTAHKANISDENYTSLSSSSKPKTCSMFPEIESNPNACDKPRLIPKSVPLQDLKFKIQDSNNLQMILYDTFSVNIKMNNATKNRINEPSTSAGVCNMESSLLHLNDDTTAATCSCIQNSYDSHLPNDKNMCTAGTVVSKNVLKNRADLKENFNPTRKSSCSNVLNNFSIVNVFDDKCCLTTR